jgi:Na+/alanine symporter
VVRIYGKTFKAPHILGALLGTILQSAIMPGMEFATSSAKPGRSQQPHIAGAL